MPDAIAVAYVFLNRRERTVAEVRTRLEREIEARNCSPEEAAAAVEELLELGYLDDTRYARLFIEDKRNLANWGRTRIENGLIDHGVEPEVIAEAFRDSEGADDEMARAAALLSQRYPQPPEDDPRLRERAFGMLVRKGYTSEIAGDAVRAWLRD